MKPFLGATLLVLGLPRVLAAQDPLCDTILISNFTLDHDMTCLGKTALRTGADGITIDLGGHTVSGNGAFGTAGIRNVGHRDVTIENGTITGFFLGVHFNGASHNAIRTITVDGNVSSGIFLGGQSNENRIEACSVIRNGTIDHPGNGITISMSDGNLVSRTLAAGNRDQGISIGGAPPRLPSFNTRILNNTSRDNVTNGMFVGPDDMFGAPANNAFEGNHATGNVLFDVRDRTLDDVIGGNESTYQGTRCDTSNPAGICVP